MCGIVGFLEAGDDLSPDSSRETLRAMTDTLSHRGPDDRGTWLDPEDGVALGHRRLAVLDLSDRGRQPMTSPAGRFVITYNGELYNFQALRRDLEREGVSFRSECDTEVLLAAVEEWGLDETLSAANGMFAFALWDRAKRELILARDRFGEKPLYYGRMGESFLFSSELKALHPHPEFRPSVDRSALAAYMRYGYVPASLSIFRGVHKLPPATYLRVSGTGAGEPRTYWSLRGVLEGAPSGRQTWDADEATGRVEEVLRKAVRRRMVAADVPVGAFLSGGIDSSTVVALMQAESSSPVRTFTIGFADDSYDEAAHANRVAEHLGTDHRQLYLSAEEAREVIPRIPTLYDEPFADASKIPTYLLSRWVRDNVTVALTGDGGDEVFGGYNRYLWLDRIRKAIRWSPAALGAAVSRGIRAVPAKTWSRMLEFLENTIPGLQLHHAPAQKLEKLAAVVDTRGPASMYRTVVSRWRNPGDIVKGATEPDTLASDPTRWPTTEDFIRQMMFVDAKSYLPHDILVKTDRASMAVGLEVRVPMLDPEVVGTAWQMPPEFLVDDGQGKRLLRNVLHRHVPSRLTDRPKAGFTVPVSAWLRGPLRSWADELLCEDRLRDEGFFQPEPIRRCWSEHISERRDHPEALWDVLMFQAWLDEWGGEGEQARPRNVTASRAEEVFSRETPLRR